MLAKGWSVTRIVEALLIDRETVRIHFKRYRKGVAALQKNDAGGSDAALTEEQQRLLDQHLRENFYLTAKEIAHYVEQTWRVTYSESGMTQLLHRLGYVYKKPKLIPGKANAERQKEFIERYQALKAKRRRMIRFISWMPRIRSTIQSLDTGGSSVARIMKFPATQVDNASTSTGLSIALDYVRSLAMMTRLMHNLR
ncbi:MAG: winged helix-turn-helix domain-containing protein [Nitrosomonas sp.]|nr:winged helix-turn-helix domain-containing protein [Nitrosomonas sp.]